MSKQLAWDEQRRAVTKNGFGARFRLRDGRVVSKIAYSQMRSDTRDEALAKESVRGGKARHYWHAHQTDGIDHCTRRVYVDEIVGVA